MKVCVVGLWHLGTVSAACLAAKGHRVVGLDFDTETVQRLNEGNPPLYEPGLEELVREGLKSQRLSFTTELPIALRQARVVWLAYDTPVDEDDRADVVYVFERAVRLFPHLEDDSLVLISSQVPAGTTRRLEKAFQKSFPEKKVHFAYSPENLRLGKAIQVFLEPDRVVVGIRSQEDRELVTELLGPITNHIEWMGVESAEMTKHALNAFLATSVSFANEIAVLCEQVGADAKEVERGLKSESRIGPRAYLGPGVAFAGGTLARDIAFLTQLGHQYGKSVPLLESVMVSNDAHKLWIRNKLVEALGSVAGQTVAVWGLTYKPGTDTLRRSSSVELCTWLASHDARVQAHDPAVKALPPELQPIINLCTTPLEALSGAAALVVATEWPDYRSETVESVIAKMKKPLVIDPNRFLIQTLGSHSFVQYLTVGKGL